MAIYLDMNGTAYLVNKIVGLINLKVNQEQGKGLSEEDFTASLKAKLNDLENYSLPAASNEELGGIKVGEGLSIDSNGVLSASGGGAAATDIDWDDIKNKPDNLLSDSDIVIMTPEDIDALFEEVNPE